MTHSVWDVVSMVIPAACAIIGFVVGATMGNRHGGDKP